MKGPPAGQASRTAGVSTPTPGVHPARVAGAPVLCAQLHRRPLDRGCAVGIQLRCRHAWGALCVGRRAGPQHKAASSNRSSRQQPNCIAQADARVLLACTSITLFCCNAARKRTHPRVQTHIALKHTQLIAYIGSFPPMASCKPRSTISRAHASCPVRHNPPPPPLTHTRTHTHTHTLLCSNTRASFLASHGTPTQVMYEPAATAEPGRDGWLRYLTSGAHPKSMAFYHTLLNTMLSYDSVGWGMPFGSWFPDVEHQASAHHQYHCAHYHTRLICTLPAYHHRAYGAIAVIISATLATTSDTDTAAATTYVTNVTRMSTCTPLPRV
jgi:hypothetical protein